MSNKGNQNKLNLSSSNRGNRYRNNKERLGIEEINLIQGQEEDNSDVIKSNALEEEGGEGERNASEEEEEEGESDIDNDSDSSEIPFGEEEDHNKEE